MSTLRSGASGSTNERALEAAFTGPQAAANIAAVKYALDDALDAWWQHGALPSTLLLRDGLLTLEAGQPLDDAQRSLLLRAAIAQRRGMLTALRHQDDPERTAVILADALLADAQPLTVAELARLRDQDGASETWWPALRAVLEEEINSADAVRRARAVAILGQIDGGAWGEIAELAEEFPILPGDEPIQRPLLQTSWARAVLVLVPLIVIVAGVIWWLQGTRNEGLIRVPAGAYVVSDAAVGGGTQTVNLPAYAIDRTEVTNAAYRKCLERAACPAPVATSSATRPQYWLDPAFSQYPVINIDQAAAAKFCAFAGKRLPSAAEWEVAAGYAPGTQRWYLYPWGNDFQVQRANSAASGFGDAQMVGSYQPIGDSPLGAGDMAGNVAEWTSTTTGDAGQMVVKGGSFLSEPAALKVAAQQELTPTTTASWLGLRCAVDIAGG